MALFMPVPEPEASVHLHLGEFGYPEAETSVGQFRQGSAGGGERLGRRVSQGVHQHFFRRRDLFGIQDLELQLGRAAQALFPDEGTAGRKEEEDGRRQGGADELGVIHGL
jgi:hypothetical protein